MTKQQNFIKERRRTNLLRSFIFKDGLKSKLAQILWQQDMSQNNQKQLQGKTVVITGASSGVGKATALAFAAKGATIIVAARREEALHELVSACEELGAKAKAIPADVTNGDDMLALAKAAIEFGGSLDIWVNNAGVLAAGPFDETPLAIHEQVVQTNLLGYIRGAYAAIPIFKQQGHGVLINNISIGGFVSLPYAGAYSASKAGLRAFCASLRAEVSALPGIHVCDLFPAFLDTPGLGHAANYTGVELNIPPAFLFDPLRVASAIVAVARQPQAITYPDFAAPIIRAAYELFPEFTGMLSEKIMRSLFKKGTPAARTSGNVLHTIYTGTGVHALNSKASSPKNHLGTAALVAGIIAGGIALFRRR